MKEKTVRRSMRYIWDFFLSHNILK